MDVVARCSDTQPPSRHDPRDVDREEERSNMRGVHIAQLRVGVLHQFVELTASCVPGPDGVDAVPWRMDLVVTETVLGVVAHVTRTRGPVQGLEGAGRATLTLER